LHKTETAVIVFQLEVLELLVHHGADLNAKTKHEETPAGELLMFQLHLCSSTLFLSYLTFLTFHCDYYVDICEDPELRERILQLRSEQETKRLQETKKRGVNRSQSNTRTQSVRRTSIRDKTIITKKDAVEEARRLAQEVSSHNVMLVVIVYFVRAAGSFMKIIAFSVLRV
jgi:protein phosphatase 1 regulatory subunit 16A